MAKYPKYQPFNDLPAAQFQALVEDVARRGVLLPILVDENDRTIDGHQRRRAAAEASVECPKIVVEGLAEDEKEELALALNLFRRHLVGVERSKALQKLANLGLSTRNMGGLLGVSKSTVHRDLSELSRAGQLDRPERVQGADGKSRPAKMPPREKAPANVNPETGEIEPGEVESVAPSSPGSLTTPSPAPKVALDPVLSYRAKFSTERSRVRSSLFLFDVERAVETSDDIKALKDFAADLIDYGQRLAAAASGSLLKAVN